MKLDYTIRRSTRARRVRVAVDAHDGVQVTLCPYVLAGEDAGERIAHLSEWHDAVLDADGRVPGWRRRRGA